MSAKKDKVYDGPSREVLGEGLHWIIAGERYMPDEICRIGLDGLTRLVDMGGRYQSKFVDMEGYWPDRQVDMAGNDKTNARLSAKNEAEQVGLSRRAGWGRTIAAIWFGKIRLGESASMEADWFVDRG